MAIEIEAKMKVAGFEAVLTKLAERGAVFVTDELEVNQFFDTATAELRNANKGLRLRTTRNLSDASAPPAAFVTFKGPRGQGQFKSRQEIEIHVAEPAETAALLTALGFGPTFSFEKRRRTWTLLDCKVELDEVPYLGTFVEIEGPGDESIAKVRQLLDLGQYPNITESYIAMLVAYTQANGIKDTAIKLTRVRS